MSTGNTITGTCHVLRWMARVGCLAGWLLIFWLPAGAWANPPEPAADQGAEKCVQCHPAETAAWKNSPHARAMKPIDGPNRTDCQPGTPGCTCLTCHTTDFNARDGTFTYQGVACEACHGPYTEGHPGDGAMQLKVDSSVCKDCHAQTFQQWSDSLHAGAGVQCIGCHAAHSQDMRLTDATLCGACHQQQLQDFSHTTHNKANVKCSDCHLSSVGPALAAAPAMAAEMGGKGVPSHRFTSVPSDVCANCHQNTIHQPVTASTAPAPDQVAQQPASSTSAAGAELTDKLAAAEQAGRFLKTMSFVTLGLGLGIGGMLGIVFMLVVGYFGRRGGQS
jgi:hypothetical protein